MRLDESYQTARHSKAVRCPRCRKSSPILIFDSAVEGMVCHHCHLRLTAIRKDACLLAKDLSGTSPKTRRRKQATCARCGNPTDTLMFDSPLAGMVCPGCHRDLVYLRQEMAGLIPERT
jgi:uncharacterized protein YbaR (Trm112 family)